ncbi:MAG TPA: nuclear transport factor 2 family protein [Nitriliruptorales bacterium]|nr:nuclear transport factor 2 family protein [Nitriliruptorales bacterium]
MGRTPQETFQHHVEALGAEDLDEIVTDYTEDAILVDNGTIRRGLEGVRQGFVELIGIVPNASWDLPTQVFEGDILYLEWTADSTENRVDDGTDTFVFTENGQIRVQTVKYTPRSKG